jgi:hypothetical protein
MKISSAETEITFFHFFTSSTFYHLWNVELASLPARTTANTELLIHKDEAVLFSFGNGLHRTNRRTGRFYTVQARKTQGEIFYPWILTIPDIKDPSEAYSWR